MSTYTNAAGQTFETGEVYARTNLHNNSTMRTIVVSECGINHHNNARGPVHFHHENGSWDDPADANPNTAYRRLFVIDPENDEEIARWVAFRREHFGRAGSTHRHFDRWVSENREAMTAWVPNPPAPQITEEPQFFGSVVLERDGQRWVRTFAESAQSVRLPWKNGDLRSEWDSLDVVEVLSTGVPL